MYKSPLRYPGGKSKAIDYLKNFVIPFKELREPFFGGGSFSIYHSQNLQDKIYSASDLNYDLFCFWSQLRHEPAFFIEEVQKLYNVSKSSGTGRELFESILNSASSPLSDLRIGVNFFVMNRITFSGLADTGGYSQESFDKRFTQSSIDRLKDIVETIKNINFSFGDYSELLNKPGEDVLLFLDPPYHSVAKSKLYGKKGELHTNFNHQLLCNNLKNTSHKWLMTYDNSEYIKNLYKDFYQIDWKLQYGMQNNHGDVVVNELLISNYDIHATRKINVANNLKSCYTKVQKVKVSEDIKKKAMDFSVALYPTLKYDDTNQTQKDKIIYDNYVGRVGEEAVNIVLSKYFKISEPDYIIYLDKDKSWAADLRVENIVDLAVKTQSQKSANIFGESWTFQFNSTNNRSDVILKKPEALVVFVIYDEYKNVCYVYPIFKIGELIFDEPKKETLKGSKKVVYAKNLPSVCEKTSS